MLTRRVWKLPAGVSREAADSLWRGIEQVCGFELTVRINDNSSQLISLRFPAGKKPQLSLHRMFVEANQPVVRALGQFVKRPTPASRRVLRDFMNSRSSELRPSNARLHVRSRGAHFDLHRLAEEVNAQYFGGSIQARITWSRGRMPERGRRHIQFGCYDGRSALIRIHPALDSATVPEFVVRFIIFHEMLHAAMQPETDADGRRYFHTPEFRRREKQHPDFEAVKQWEEEFLKTF